MGAVAGSVARPLLFPVRHLIMATRTHSAGLRSEQPALRHSPVRANLGNDFLQAHE